ncbi:hypothetical protein C8R42DRAFT_554600, partial [Lentinula raphanica]
SDKLDHKAYDGDRGEFGGHAIPPSPRIQITQKITHPGEVNGARYMPQNPELLATKAVTGEVLVFDRMKHASEPEPDGVWFVLESQQGWTYIRHIGGYD